MAASPLSTAVAAFVWVAAEAALTRKLEVIRQLTMDAGNTFQLRSGHTFTVEREDVPTVFQQKRIAIFGAGDIGLRVLQLFARTEARIVYSARSAKSLDVSGDIDFSPSINALLEMSEPIDILTIHLPSSVYVSLSKVRQIEVFIQTSSGYNIDEEELLQALDEGRIRTAIVDVFSHEGKHFAGSIDPQTGKLVQSTLNPFAHPLDTREDRARKKRLQALIEQKRLLLMPHIAYLEKRAITRTLLFAIYNILSLGRSIIMQLQLL
jgi:lactate dehydrogenase-like 2-hydroxyacid dehydrogenase